MGRRHHVHPPLIRPSARRRPAWDCTRMRVVEHDWDLSALQPDHFPPGRSEAEILAIVDEIARALTK